MKGIRIKPTQIGKIHKASLKGFTMQFNTHREALSFCHKKSIEFTEYFIDLNMCFCDLYKHYRKLWILGKLDNNHWKQQILKIEYELDLVSKPFSFLAFIHLKDLCESIEKLAHFFSKLYSKCNHVTESKECDSIRRKALSVLASLEAQETSDLNKLIYDSIKSK